MFRKHKKKILFHLAASLATSFIVLGAAGAFVWWKRAEIFHYFASQFLTQTQSAPTTDEVKKETVRIITQEALVVDVVKKSDPAVFSIVISKDVPIVEQYFDEWNPFKDFFGGDFGGFQIPQYRQKGTEKREVGGGTEGHSLTGRCSDAGHHDGSLAAAAESNRPVKISGLRGAESHAHSLALTCG